MFPFWLETSLAQFLVMAAGTITLLYQTFLL
jgi:hypothetical protein